MHSVFHALGAQDTIRAAETYILDGQRVLKTKLLLEVFGVPFL